MEQENTEVESTDKEIQAVEEKLVQMGSSGNNSSINELNQESDHKDEEKTDVKPDVEKGETKVESVNEKVPETNEEAARLRKKIDALENKASEVDKLKEKIKEIESMSSKDESSQTIVSADKVFSLYRNALQTENAQLKSDAELVISNMGISEIRSVMSKANQGGFGEASADIYDLASKALIEVMADRTSVSEQSKAEEENKQKTINDWASKHIESLKKINETYKELADPNSEQSKAVTEYIEKNVFKMSPDGKITHKGPLFFMLSNPAYKEELIPVIMEIFESKKLSSKAKEADELKKKIERSQIPSGGSKPQSAGTSIQDENQKLEDKLRALGRS